VFTPAALYKKVTLGGEMGEPRTLGVLPTELLALLRCVGVSVVVDDVVLREVTGPFHKVPTHSSLVHRRGERRSKQEDEDREERLHRSLFSV